MMVLRKQCVSANVFKGCSLFIKFYFITVELYGFNETRFLELQNNIERLLPELQKYEIAEEEITENINVWFRYDNFNNKRLFLFVCRLSEKNYK